MRSHRICTDGLIIMLFFAFALAASPFPLLLTDTPEPPERVGPILAGVGNDALSGDDVLVLERHVGDAAGLVRAVDAAVSEECRLSSDEASSQLRVGRRLLAVALLEAAKGRGGTAMALSTSVDLSAALARCLPFGVGTSVGKELALSTASLATYLRVHGALDDADALALSRSLEKLAPEKAASLSRPVVVVSALVLVPASVKCRVVGDKMVLSASEAREIGRRYQTRQPRLEPVFSAKGIDGMRVTTDAFLASCGFEDGDVVVEINGIDARQPDRILGIAERIGSDRHAVVIVLRAGARVTVTIDEDKT